MYVCVVVLGRRRLLIYRNVALEKALHGWCRLDDQARYGVAPWYRSGVLLTVHSGSRFLVPAVTEGERVETHFFFIYFYEELSNDSPGGSKLVQASGGMSRF